MDSQVLLVAPLAALLVDISNYGIKEWFAVVGSLFGIGGSVFGIWRAWRYSKTQIAERLLDYLRDEEMKIKKARNRIIRRLRRGEWRGGDIEHEFYRDVKSALDDPAQAERKLDSFVETVTSDIKVGQKYLDNANLQLATAFLVKGTSANSRSEKTAARNAWERALRCYSQDGEAERYLGELALAEGDDDTALEHFDRAYALAPDDKLLKAETWESMAVYYQQQGRRKLELGALDESGQKFADEGMHSRAAAAYARAGELAAQLGHNRQAPELLSEAFENYRLANDREGMRATRKKLEDLGEEVSHLPSFDEIRPKRLPWLWIRLSLELSILGAAAYLFFLTLR